MTAAGTGPNLHPQWTRNAAGRPGPRVPRDVLESLAMLVPATVPGVVDRRAAQLLQSRWTRARGYLLTAIAVCPVGIVLLCASMLVPAGAVSGFAWWLLLPVIGSALPAAAMLAGTRGMMYEPPRWVRAAALTGGCQLLLGVFPAVGLAVGAGGAAAVAATVVFVLALAMVALGVFSAVRAMRTLLSPVSPALGAAPFTVALRARVADTGLLSGSVSIARDGVEWAARRHRATGHGAAPFDRLRGARPASLPGTTEPVPWLRLSDGSVACATPGPAVLLTTDSGDVLLPVDDPQLFVELLNARVTTWRGGAARS